MSKAKSYGRSGIGQRVGQDAFYFEYRDGDTYVRRTVSKAALTAFLTNGLDKDSNRAPGAQSIALEPFLRDHYLPKCAAPRLNRNPQSLNSEKDLADALARTLGQASIHEIRSSHAEKHKTLRLAQGRANTTIKKELLLLGRAMNYAMSAGLITKNLLTPVKGLPGTDRSWIWLRLKQIESLLDNCPDRTRGLIEFLILTGARRGEAELLQKGDIRRDLSGIAVPTEKRKRPARECMRILKVANLGPRFGALLSKLTPDPLSGLYFPLSRGIVDDDFAKARKQAGLDQLFPEVGFHIHDLRGTYAVHRSMAGVAARQLQYEVGHKSWESLQSYLGRAEEFEPEDSIFFMPAPIPQVVSEPPIAPPSNTVSPGTLEPRTSAVHEIVH
jgi:integrase